MLLRIIAAAASRFPPEEAASLSRDLLKVCMLLILCMHCYSDLSHCAALGHLHFSVCQPFASM